MTIGKCVRLNRIFSHPSGRLCSVAVDHFIGYQDGLPSGLRHIQRTLASLADGRPDAITMHKGLAASAWAPYAGKIPLIVQSTIARPDDSACEQLAEPVDAVRLGADAFAIAVFVRGATEATHLATLAKAVRQAGRYEMPVVCHVYPRTFRDGPAISFDPEDIAWAMRCAVEAGADVVKVPYCGDVGAYADIVKDCPVPMVAAGGPKANALDSALAMVADVIKSGARGATIGRNVWGFEAIAETVVAFKAVIHGNSPS